MQKLLRFSKNVLIMLKCLNQLLTSIMKKEKRKNEKKMKKIKCLGKKDQERNGSRHLFQIWVIQTHHISIFKFLWLLWHSYYSLFCNKVFQIWEVSNPGNLDFEKIMIKIEFDYNINICIVSPQT